MFGGTVILAGNRIVALRANTAADCPRRASGFAVQAGLRGLASRWAVLLGQVTGSVGAAAEGEVDAALEQAIENRLREIAIMRHIAQTASGLLVVSSMGRC